MLCGSEHGKGEADDETRASSKTLEAAVLCRMVFVFHAADPHQLTIHEVQNLSNLGWRAIKANHVLYSKADKRQT